MAIPTLKWRLPAFAYSMSRVGLQFSYPGRGIPTYPGYVPTNDISREINVQ